MGRWKVTTAPASEPITQAEAKTHLRVDDTNSDTYITNLIIEARQAVEQYLGAGLMIQTITEKFDDFPAANAANPKAALTLSVWPLRSITSIKYNDTDGTEQTFAGTKYVVDDYGKFARIVTDLDESWPSVRGELNDVEVIYSVGYDDAASVPGPIKRAMYLILADWFEYRQNDAGRLLARKLPTTAEWALNRYIENYV